MKQTFIKIKLKHIPDAKVGDMLTMTIRPDVSTLLHNAHKITDIQKKWYHTCRMY